MEKKTWLTPQLVELVRGTPEEAVLTVCKSGELETHPHGGFLGCQNVPAGPSCGPVAPTGHINADVCSPCSGQSCS